jgi:RimJ/RimL family protein N-acetyltransferase
MFEAINTVLKFGFEKMKLNSIFAECSKNNKDSIRLLERLGFRLDGALTTEQPPRNDLEFVSYRLDAPSKKDS